MDIQELKNACNEKYAQAIEGMERGEPNSGIARLLLDAAELLVEISKADFLTRVTSEQKATKLLAAAKKLRAMGDTSAVYRDLTGRTLKVIPKKFVLDPHTEETSEHTQKDTAQAPQSVEQPKQEENAEGDAPQAEERITGEPQKKTEEQSDEQVSEAEKGESDEPTLDELKGLLHSKSGKGKAYGKEDTSGYRFAWDDLPKISFDDVAGLADVKEAVMRKVLLPLKNPELYEGYIKKNGGGLLLYGPPGTGKTMIAAAIAHEIGAKFCSLGPSDLVMQGVGNSETAAVALFKEARSFPCAVLFFDEIESICPASTHAQGARQLRSELLRQIQGMEAYGEQNDKILFLIAATNKPWDIDPAFIRPGRFGTRIYVGLPDAPARQYMLEMRLNKILQTGKVIVGNIDAAQIVEKTEGFNGADMANLLDEVQELSALRSAKTGIKEILQEDFDNALKKITSSVQEKDMQKLREWKEQNG